jgi:hypothetical protein
MTTAESGATAAKAVALANGLRKSVLATARRWAAWPRGAQQFGVLVGCIERTQQRAAQARAAKDELAAAACMADLRVLLEWTTYHAASLATARGVVIARRTRVLSRRLGLFDDRDAPLLALAAAEDPLIEKLREKNASMRALAQQRPDLGLPQPLVSPEMLALPPVHPPSRLALIQALKRASERSQP